MIGLRFSLPFLAVVLLAGCQHGPGGTIDPFGRTTIPPPPTGTAAIHAPRDQYYGKPTRPMVPVAAKPGNATASNATTPGAQPANWVSNASATADPQNRLQPIPPYEKEATPGTPPPATSPSVAQPVAANTTAAAPQHATPPQPPAASPAPTSVKPPAATPIDPTAPLQWASGNPSPTAAATAQAKTVTGQNVTVRREPVQQNPPRIARFGHAKDYTRLRGQLEYSAQDRVWKIRYIPIHGQQDAYGGQFILSDRSKLEAFQVGDYVTIEGAIIATKTVAGNTGGNVPQYAPHSVAPLSP